MEIQNIVNLSCFNYQNIRKSSFEEKIIHVTVNVVTLATVSKETRKWVFSLFWPDLTQNVDLGHAHSNFDALSIENY